MELLLENNIKNNLEMEQNKFLDSALGKAINNGIDIGIRYILPDYFIGGINDLKDNLLKYGLKEGISKTINSVIDKGKALKGIVTGNFENISQINEAIKSGGIIDSVSNLLDDVLSRVSSAGKINNTTLNLIKNGKDSILSSVEKNIESTLNKQLTKSEKINNYIDNLKIF